MRVGSQWWLPHRNAPCPLRCAGSGLADTPLYEDGLVLGRDHLKGWAQLQLLGYRCAAAPLPRRALSSSVQHSRPSRPRGSSVHSGSQGRPASTGGQATGAAGR